MPKRLPRRINWINGMLIDAEHFKQQDDYVVDMLGWMSGSLAASYGLVANKASKSDGIVCEVVYKFSDAYLVVKKCHAVLPSGDLVCFDSDFYGIDLEYALPNTDDYPKELFLKKVGDSFAVFGEPDTSETLARSPFIISKYVIVEREEAGADSIPICQIIRRQDDFEVSKDYFPPVVYIYAHRPLEEYVLKLGQLMFEIRKKTVTMLGRFDKEVKVTRTLDIRNISFAIFEFNKNLLLECDRILRDVQANQITLTQEDVIKGLSAVFSPVNFTLEVYPKFRELVLNDFFIREFSMNEGEDFFQAVSKLALQTYRPEKFVDDLRNIEKNMNILLSLLRFLTEQLPHISEEVETKLVDNVEYTQTKFGRVNLYNEEDEYRFSLDGLSLNSVKGLVGVIEKRLLGDIDPERISAYMGVNQDDAIATMEPCIVHQDRQETKYVNIVPRQPLEVDFVDRLNIILIGRLNYQTLSEIDARSGNLRIYYRSRNV